MIPVLYNRLWIWIRDLAWGRDLGRARRYLVLSILAISLIGKVAVWAEPRLDAWLFPPPPPPPAFCSRVAIVLSKALLTSDINAAKLWVGEPNTPMPLAALTWDNKDKRVELWMTDGKETFWQIEFVCFKASRGHPMVFGEFEKYSFQEIIDQERYQESIESLTK